MNPYNYSIDAGMTPTESFAQGAQLGLGLQQIRAQRQQAEAAAAQQAQMNADLYAASQDISKIPQLMVRYPQLADKLKHGWDAKTSEQQRADLDHGGQVLAALATGRGDVAAEVLRARATALRNSGDEQNAKVTEALAEAALQSPDILKQATALRIAALPGGDKVIEGIAKLGGERRADELQPSAVEKAQAEAVTAGVEAKYAEQKSLLDLQKKGWDIKKIAADIDIAKAANRIAAMNAATSRANSETQRQELGLKVQEARMKLDERIREKAAEAETGATSIDNMLNTIERIKGNKSLDDVLGSIEGGLPAMITSGMDDEESDAIRLIETLGSQAFLSQIPTMKGQGALSNAEGEKLQSALTNLSRAQSEKQFRANLDEAARLLKKGRETLSKRTGVPLGKPDTPAAPGARPPLSSFGGG